MEAAQCLQKAETEGLREVRDPEELEQEFAAIYKREYPVALRYARRHVDDMTAEDIVQNVFLNFWEGYIDSPPRTFRRAKPEAVTATIIKAVRNLLKNKHRDAKCFRDNKAAIREHITRNARGRTPADLGLGERDLSALLDELLAKLPPRQREVFMLVKFDGMTYELTAAILGVSVSTVHQHLVKANAFLRRELAPYKLPEPSWWFPIDETLNDEAKTNVE